MQHSCRSGCIWLAVGRTWTHATVPSGSVAARYWRFRLDVYTSTDDPEEERKSVASDAKTSSHAEGCWAQHMRYKALKYLVWFVVCGLWLWHACCGGGPCFLLPWDGSIAAQYVSTRDLGVS